VERGPDRRKRKATGSRRRPTEQWAANGCPRPSQLPVWPARPRRAGKIVHSEKPT
jgi:hypothetical protein